MKTMKSIKYIKWSLTVFSLLLVLNPAKAQHEPQFTQYMFNETFINPAYAGSHEGVSANLLYRDQWVGLHGSPKTETFTIHTSAAKRKLGLGLSVMNESIGVSKKFVVCGDFAYRILMPNSVFSFGLQGGIVNEQENLTTVQTNVGGDNQFATDIRKYFLPNAGFGMYYYYKKKFYAGISIPRLLENKIDASQPNVVVHNVGNPKIWHYYFTTGYVFQMAENVKFKPSIMVKAVTNSPVELDGNLNFLFHEFLWLGASYRTGDAVAGLVGFQISKQLRVGYSYDYTLSDLQRFNGGSHEFTLCYDFGSQKHRVVSPRYF
jgi:type IX secretion system PorP/SprF family membrane protein